MGYKEIEVGFPSASQTDFDFVRQLIEGNHIPDDVTIQVLTQAREHLIERTYESLVGRRAGDRPPVQLHVRPAAPRGLQPGRGRHPGHRHCRARGCARSTRRTLADTHITYEYSPESFTGTELEYAVAHLQRGGRRLRGLGGPARSSSTCPPRWRWPPPTSTPTPSSGCAGTCTTAEAIILSLHPHNDRGTGVAAAELGYLAGADRIEGCLFGNGERTGNVDLVTLGLNLFVQGIDPDDRLLRHRRHPPHRGVLQPAAASPSGPPTAATWSSPPSPARTRTPSRRASRRWRRTPRRPARTSTTSPGPCPTCRSTRRTSAAATRPSSGSTRSPARAASPTCSRTNTAWTCRAARRSSSPASSSSTTDTVRRRGQRRRALADLPGRVPARPDSADRQWGRYSLDSVNTETDDEDGDMTLTRRPDGRRRPGPPHRHRQRPDRGAAEHPREDGVDVRVLDYSEHALSEGGRRPGRRLRRVRRGGARALGRRHRRQHQHCPR